MKDLASLFLAISSFIIGTPKDTVKEVKRRPAIESIRWVESRPATPEPQLVERKG